MNVSNATELYNYTEWPNDLLTFNTTVTLSSVTLTPVIYNSGDAIDNRGLPTTPTQGKPLYDRRQDEASLPFNGKSSSICQQVLTSHSTIYRSFRGQFYGSHDPNNNVTWH